MRKSFDFPKGSRIHYNDKWVTNNMIILDRREVPLNKNLQSKLNKYASGTIEYYKTKREKIKEDHERISFIQAYWEDWTSQRYDNFKRYIEIEPTEIWFIDNATSYCVFTNKHKKVFVAVSEHYYWLPLEYTFYFVIDKTKIKNNIYEDKVFILSICQPKLYGLFMPVKPYKDLSQILNWEQVKETIRR